MSKELDIFGRRRRTKSAKEASTVLGLDGTYKALHTDADTPVLHNELHSEASNGHNPHWQLLFKRVSKKLVGQQEFFPSWTNSVDRLSAKQRTMAEISYKLEILKEAVSRTRARPSPGGKENDDDLQARQISGLFDACMMYGDDERTDRKYREVADTLFSHWGDQNYDLAHRARELLGYTEKVKDRIFFKAVNWNDNNLERAALHIDKTRKRLNAEVIFDDQLPEGLVSRAKAKDRGSIATNVGLELASLISGEVVANITPLGNVHNDMALILIAIASLAPVWTGIVVKGIENTKLLDKTGTSMIYPAKVLYDRFQSVSKKAQQIGANVGYYGYQLPFELVYFITAYMEGDFKKGAALLIAANIVSAAELTAQIVGSRKHRLGYQKANVDPFIVSE